ncbi:MAG: penicillin-insensitive murein endopeptidase [Bradymonadaceae bacterium]
MLQIQHRRVVSTSIVLAMVLVGSATIHDIARAGDGESASTGSTQSSGGEGPVYAKADRRDTLASIALERGVGVERLQKLNELELGELTPGMRVLVEPRDESADEKKDQEEGSQPVVHRVSAGETFGEIAHMYNVSVRQVRRWNPDVDPRHLQIGERIRLHVPGEDGASVSWGRASDGRLYNGKALKDSPGFEVRDVAVAYGTDRVVRMLKAAAADVKARWPNAPRLVVGDLSYKRGGPMPPHESHQSGRDADIGYYHRGNVQLKNFEPMTEETFDARKTWHFLKSLIDTGQVEYVFVEYDLQEEMYEYARSIGYSTSRLRDIFQYPRPRHERKGIIRQTGGHDDHLHIRFKCAPDAKRCR